MITQIGSVYILCNVVYQKEEEDGLNCWIDAPEGLSAKCAVMLFRGLRVIRSCF